MIPDPSLVDMNSQLLGSWLSLHKPYLKLILNCKSKSLLLNEIVDPRLFENLDAGLRSLHILYELCLEFTVGFSSSGLLTFCI